MTERAKRPSAEKDLPTCYQFGDARPVLCHFCRRDITKEAKLSLRGDRPRSRRVECTDCAKLSHPYVRIADRLSRAGDESAAYEPPPATTERELIIAEIDAITAGWAPWHMKHHGRPSAAYRITQAQKAHDNRSECPRCLTDAAYLPAVRMWRCDTCAINWKPSDAKKAEQ